MSYNTRYRLEHAPKSLGVSPSIELAMETLWDGQWNPFEGGETSWYEHEDHMKKLSLTFPDVLFTLSGEGEQNDDIWKKYFRNGKMQVAKAVITIEEFDSKKLK